MPTASLSTATAAEIFAVMTLLHPPTISPFPAALEQQTRAPQRTTTRGVLATGDGYFRLAQATQITSIAAIPNLSEYDELDRPTTSREKLIGELGRWSLFSADWDGEGGAAPIARSLREAVSFVGLLAERYMLPEPMLHGSGQVGLFWKDDGLYADIEFLGDGRIAYYIERQGDEHKGVLKFNGQEMPPMFPALLTPQRASL